jgi:hypothetical protein
MSSEIVITIERTPGAPTVAIYSENPNITVVRDAGATDSELLAAYTEAREDSRNLTA